MNSRLAGFMIDCRNGDLDAASKFWSGALGLSIVDADEGGAGRYAVLSPVAGGLHLEVQMVEHDARLGEGQGREPGQHAESAFEADLRRPPGTPPSRYSS